MRRVPIAVHDKMALDQVLPGLSAGGGGCPSQSQSRPEDTEEQFAVWVSRALSA
jgi:hypothetical protein